MSFCIMFTSNHASSGCSSTNGPRYVTIGDAITVPSSTSTAFSRGMPLFSAISTAFAEREHLHGEAEVRSRSSSSPPRRSAPTWKTFGPIASSTGWTRSKTSSSPPTITDELALLERDHAARDRSVEHVRAQLARRAPAIARELSGLAVYMST